MFEFKRHRNRLFISGYHVCFFFLGVHSNEGTHWERLNLQLQEDAIVQILEIINKYPKDSEVYIECDMLGTEEILFAINKAFGTKVPTRRSYLF
jgi:hypothetical protein